MKHFQNNPGQLYKNPDKGMIAGVCAGVADYFSINVTLVRFVTVIGGLVSGFWLVLIYIAAAMLLDPRPENLYAGPDEENFWRTYRHAPSDMLSKIQRKFERLERKIQRLEKHVTSKRYQLDNEFEKLGK